MRFLLTSAPLHGHVAPLLSVALELTGRGHEVTLLTGSEYAGWAARSGCALRVLPDTARGSVPPASVRRRPRVLAGRDAILGTFVRPLVAQHDALAGALAAAEWDAVLCDTAYLGALPLLLRQPPGERPPMLGLSATPLSLVSVDCAPFGSALQPGHSVWSRIRNRQIQWLLRHGPLRPLHRELDTVLAGLDVPTGRVDFFDQAARFDVTFHLSPRELEYPRRELPPSVHFVGPLPPAAAPGPLPEWWAAGLGGGQPVVHVTQGTLDNGDLGKLIGPTVRALADEPVLTVVATGGAPIARVEEAVGGNVPANVRVAEYLPYDQLLPRTSVVVSNGGYGGVQQALRHGVPVVIAGDTEDKPEVAARVRRVGAGIDLHTGTPAPRRIREAVRRALGDPAYRAGAARVRRSMLALGDARATVADGLERAASH